MWIALVAGWIVGSIGLYAYIVATAKEPRKAECFDCKLTECSECPYSGESQSQQQLKRAA